MFLTILVTVIICLLLFVCYTEYQARCRIEKKCSELRSENRNLKSKNQEYHDWEVKRLCNDKYRQGLEEGSKCDVLYRSILSKYKAHEQITVMMYGEREGDDEHETGNSRGY